MNEIQGAGYVLLEDGTTFAGFLCGDLTGGVGEVVFNTAMTGYQEAVTDPSYAGQIVTFTYPMIGNYGVSPAAMESDRPHARGVIMREARNGDDAATADGGWLDWLQANGVWAITGVNTRMLVRHVRDKGAMRGGIFPAATPVDEAAARVAAEPGMVGSDFVTQVSPTEAIEHAGDGPHVVALDTGIKQSIVNQLLIRSARVTLLPSVTSAETVKSLDPDLIFLANGPGDPAAVERVVETIRDLVGVKPMVGICLGHQLLCRAVGLETFKLPFGHRGSNHPVKDLKTGVIEITSQNHGFAVVGPGGDRTIDTDEPVRWDTGFGSAELTHINLYDRTVEGLNLPDARAMTVQHHPEAGPGPHDSRHLFDRFLDLAKLMPRRDDIKKILLIGSGPIVIGQAAEFDYSGVQACKVLLEEGYEVVLVNSNPATIMTDPEFATRTYVEPLLPGPVAAIIEKERPDALLPTLGGQTALNLAMDLSADGTLEKYGVELIGANREAIIRAEDREVFRQVMNEAEIRIPWSITVESVEGALESLDHGDASLPAIIRPAFTMGGQGGGIAETREELIEVVAGGIAASPIGQVLVEESVIGWGEFELEVMRDRNDNVVIICSIENVDPMGVHTGDSITVAPAQSLPDPIYQELRDIAIKVIRVVGVETGGSNVQFAVNPADGEIAVIEMNPRVSRSSALASKATGFPIAKMAAKLAVGYALEEIPNDITRATPASFEPTIDYVVTKIPRFAFEKFPGSTGRLSTYMQSVGEVMSIGRTFKESFSKALQSRELDAEAEIPATVDGMLDAMSIPTPDRIDLVLAAFKAGARVDDVHDRTKIDPWFLRELRSLAVDGDGTEGLERIYNSVDTCAAEFEAATPYYYSSHEQAGSPSEIRRGDKPSVVILGAGPNRIGQGIEFDYCCVHAAMTVRDCGKDAVMINCNPETVSTDYDTSDRLYFEPLTLEHVLAVCEHEKPEGVIVQFGGQTPLKLAEGLKAAGIPLLGTPVEAIDAAEDRGKFGAVIDRLGIKPPPYGSAMSADEAEVVAEEVGFPLLVRPSFVLGGRAMEICYSKGDLRTYLDNHVKASPEHPLLLDRFLENAIEIDVDALCDGTDVFVAGIMQHVEEAGIHSGDSACVLPPMSIGDEMLDEIRTATSAIALELGVIGLINIQFALAAGELYVIEANPRASRTVPFVSKAVGTPLAKVATRIMLGEKLSELNLPEFTGTHVSVKEAVLPFSRFAGADSVLGPEMKSTGEVIGIGKDFPTAFGKAQAAAGVSLPEKGTVFISVTDTDKAPATQLAALLHDMGFEVVATGGTAQAISRMGVPVRPICKIIEGSPNVVDLIENRECDLVINTPTGSGARADGYEIRAAAIQHGIPSITTMTGASAAVRAIAAHLQGPGEVVSLQELHGG